MSPIPNLRNSGRKSASTEPYYFVDTPFDYRGMVSTGQPIAVFDKPVDVAIIGAGMAGLAAGYELLRAGCNVTIYEQSGRVGGRCYSKQFAGITSDSVFAEMGAMRVPFSEQLFYHYADLVGVEYNDTFPDPGKVDTILRYKGQSQLWKAGQPVPDMFKKVHDGWTNLVDNPSHTFKVNGNEFMTPGHIATILQSNDIQQVLSDVVPKWQQYIDYFKAKSFFTSMTEIFTFNTDTPPGGVSWNYPEDYEVFGALGIGSGGFGPLYQESFLEMLRLMTNGLETDQQFIVSGVSSLPEGLIKQTVPTPSGGSATLGECVRYDTKVYQLTRQAEGWQLTIEQGESAGTVDYDYVISAISPRALQDLISPAVEGWRKALGVETTFSLENLHMISSSKCFILTKNTNWPIGNIQSDTLFRGLYNLDYPNVEGYGVVLLSYTWEDDSRKFPGLGTDPNNAGDRNDRYNRLLEDISVVYPQMGDFLKTNGIVDTVTFIDWDNEFGYFGAFKLDRPGQETFVQQAFYQFQQCKSATADPHLYIANDSVSWNGGWIEGALHTGLNSACAVMYSAGLRPSVTPVTGLDPNLYNYAGS